MDMGGYGEFSTEKSGYGWIWIRPSGVEWVSEFCLVKGSIRKHFFAEEIEFFRDEYRFYRFLRDHHTLRSFFSDWLMFKLVERVWLMSLCGTVHRFDKTNNYKRIKRNNDGKCLFLITQWKTIKPKLMTAFIRKWTISFNLLIVFKLYAKVR